MVFKNNWNECAATKLILKYRTVAELAQVKYMYDINMPNGIADSQSAMS